MLLLGLNIDHAATLRQARYRGREETANAEPDPVALALLAEKAGADGITVHLREDRRHIQDRDVWRLRESLTTRLNFEMACTPAMTDFALRLKPEAVCLVPEGREEVTTEGGLDVRAERERIRACVEALTASGIAVSLFIDPDPAQIEAAAGVRAPVVELHTGAYASGEDRVRQRAELARLETGAGFAAAAGLVVNAGHGINYLNIAELRAVPHLHELNIGHSIISRALLTGISEAVREMKALMNPG